MWKHTYLWMSRQNERKFSLRINVNDIRIVTRLHSYWKHIDFRSQLWTNCLLRIQFQREIVLMEWGCIIHTLSFNQTIRRTDSVPRKPFILHRHPFTAASQSFFITTSIYFMSKSVNKRDRGERELSLSWLKLQPRHMNGSNAKGGEKVKTLNYSLLFIAYRILN